MRYQPLDKTQLQALLTAAEHVCQAANRKSPIIRSEDHGATEAGNAPAADIKEEPEVDLVGNITLASLSDGMFMDLDERLDSLPAASTAEAEQEPEAVNEAAIGECAAYMAAEWCGVLGGAYASSAAADFGLAGLAAAVVVASCPRYPQPGHQLRTMPHWTAMLPIASCLHDLEILRVEKKCTVAYRCSSRH